MKNVVNLFLSEEEKERIALNAIATVNESVEQVRLEYTNKLVPVVEELTFEELVDALYKQVR